MNTTATHSTAGDWKCPMLASYEENPETVAQPRAKRSFLSFPSLRCLFFEQFARCLPCLARLGRGLGGLFAR
ncbi:MAG: hypothetical protein P3W95_001565, partial [Tepidimonas taiwanensis]|nr:hypothetical protein [Tepidimonas taiwanensis]